MPQSIYSIRQLSICLLTSALETFSSNIRLHIGHCIALGCFWGFLAANSAWMLDCLCFFPAGSFPLLNRFVADFPVLRATLLLPCVLIASLSGCKLSGLLQSCSSSDVIITTSSLSRIPSSSTAVPFLSGSLSEDLAASGSLGLKKCLMVGGAVVAFCKYFPMTADTGSTRLDVACEWVESDRLCSSEASRSITAGNVDICTPFDADICTPFSPAAAAAC